MTVRGLDFEGFMASIRMMDPKYLIWMVFATSVTFFLRALRWRLILSKIKVIPFLDLFKYLMAGFFLNNSLPMRAGEFYRAYMLGTNYRFSRSGCMASIVVERASDAVAFLAIIAVAVSVFPLSRSVTSGIYLMIAGLSAALIMLLSAVKLKNIYLKILSVVPLPEKYKNKAQNMLNGFLSGLGVLWSAKNMLAVLGVSFAVWLCEMFSAYLLVKAFGLDLAFYKITVLLTMLGFGVMIPLAPGYVGTFEFAGKTALEMLGVDTAAAVAYVIVLHVFQIVFIAIFGIPSLFATHFKLDILKQKGKTV